MTSCKNRLNSNSISLSKYQYIYIFVYCTFLLSCKSSSLPPVSPFQSFFLSATRLRENKLRQYLQNIIKPHLMLKSQNYKTSLSQNLKHFEMPSFTPKTKKKKNHVKKCVGIFMGLLCVHVESQMCMGSVLPSSVFMYVQHRIIFL